MNRKRNLFNDLRYYIIIDIVVVITAIVLSSVRATYNIFKEPYVALMAGLGVTLFVYLGYQIKKKVQPLYNEKILLKSFLILLAVFSLTIILPGTILTSGGNEVVPFFISLYIIGFIFGGPCFLMGVKLVSNMVKSKLKK